MNARTQLALMAKARHVFESEDTFLSFPVLTPISYPEAKLGFVGPDVDLATLGEFFSLVNRIPRGVVFDAAQTEHLWDVYHALLRAGEIAESAPSPAAVQAYERATSVLFVTDADGRRQDSLSYLAYKQHRDAWIAAMEELRMGERTAGSGLDPAAAEAWASGGAEAARRKVQDTEARWAGEGFRAEVEEAEQAVRAYVERPSALRLWTEWRDAFDPNVDLLTLPDGRAFAPTAFTPADAFASEWPEFTLSAAEIDQLAAEAPSELRDVLDVDDAKSRVERVAFEYRSVGLTRPWLRPDVFRARFWRLPPGEPALRDAAQPDAGRCPAYVTAVVFARRITEVERKPDGALGTTRVKALPALRMRAVVAARAAPAPAPAATPLAARLAGRVAIRRAAIPAVAPKPASPRPTARAAALRHAALAPRVAERKQALVLARLDKSAFRARPAVTLPATPTPDPRKDDVSILAFVCKRLPACPDPDPTLPWPP